MAECEIGQLLDLSESQDKPPDHESTCDLNVISMAKENKGTVPPGESPLKNFKDLSIEECRGDKSLPSQNMLSPTLLLSEDIKLIDQEEFDFDLPLSPTETNESAEQDEDEVFFGPVGHTEKLMSKVVDEEEKTNDMFRPLSPLSAQDVVKLFHEAQLVAYHLTSGSQSSSSSDEKTEKESRNVVKSFTFGASKGSTGDSPLGVPLQNSEENTTPHTSRTRKNTFTCESPLNTLSYNSKEAITNPNSDKKNPKKNKDFLKTEIQVNQAEVGPIKFTAQKIPIETDCRSGHTPSSGKKAARHKRGVGTPGSGQKQYRKSGLQQPGKFKPPAGCRGINGPSQNKRKSTSPQSMKRRRLGSNESVDDENSSIMSEESESSLSLLPGSKRSMPQQRSKKPITSAMMPPLSMKVGIPSYSGHKRTCSNSSTSSTCSNVSTQSMHEVRSTIPKPVGLRRSNSASKIAKPTCNQPITSGVPTTSRSGFYRQGSLRRTNVNANHTASANQIKPAPVVVKQQERCDDVQINSSLSAEPPSSGSGLQRRSSLRRPNKYNQGQAMAENNTKQPNSTNCQTTKSKCSEKAATKSENICSSATSQTHLTNSQPHIKGQMTKLQLLKPSDLQRKSLTLNRSINKNANSSKLSTGPLKAIAPVASKTESNLQLGKPSQRPPTPVKVKAVEGSQCQTKNRALPQPLTNTTPVKPDRSVQPRKLIQPSPSKAGTPKKPLASNTPRKNSDSGLFSCSTPTTSENKRRSFLPTPKSSRSMSVGSSVSEVSRISVSSHDSEGPVFSSRKSPAVGVLIDLNGMDPNTPSCMKSRRPKVQHTPLNGNKENQAKLSVWSPVKRQKPVIAGDEYFLCTKKTYHLGQY